jgi:membrane protein
MIRRAVRTLRDFVVDFIEDDVVTMAAALSFYTTLALSPLLVLAVTIAGSISADAQERLVVELVTVTGPQIEPLLRQIISSATDQADLRRFAGWASLVIVLVAASGVFSRLQSALNRIWACESPKLAGMWGFLRRRVLSAGILLALIFVTVVSLAFQAMLASLRVLDDATMVTFGGVLGFAVYTILFTALYRWLPDARVPWVTAVRGGALTAALFVIGRLAIGAYLARTDAAGAFGPAGAVILWLLWTYYNALIFMFSAELLYAVAKSRGWAWLPQPIEIATTNSATTPVGASGPALSEPHTGTPRVS